MDIVVLKGVLAVLGSKEWCPSASGRDFSKLVGILKFIKLCMNHESR